MNPRQFANRHADPGAPKPTFGYLRG